MARVNYPVLSTHEARRPERISDTLVGIMQGQLNVVLEITLTVGTQTVIDHALILAQSAVVPVPANAAAAALGVVWADPTVQVNTQATLIHPTAAGTELYHVLVIG